LSFYLDYIRRTPLPPPSRLPTFFWPLPHYPFMSPIVLSSLLVYYFILQWICSWFLMCRKQKENYPNSIIFLLAKIINKTYNPPCTVYELIGFNWSMHGPFHPLHIPTLLTFITCTNSDIKIIVHSCTKKNKK
jgi:hypothetical protein